MLRHRRLTWCSFFLLGFLAIFLFSPGLLVSDRAEAAGMSLRPPFNGVYRVTSFFDHYLPAGGIGDPDGRITIYTGEIVDDCAPHCYKGHTGWDWSMQEGTPILAPAKGVILDHGNQPDLCGKFVKIDHQNGYYTYLLNKWG